MKIKALKYSRYPNTNKEWYIVGKDNKNNEDYVYFDSLNLLVSKNAGGKTRTLDVIRELSEFLDGTRSVLDSTYSSQIFDFIFEDKNIEYSYLLEITDRKVSNERLVIDKDLIFDRKKNYFQKGIVSKDLSDNQLILNNQSVNKEKFSDILFWSRSVKTFFSNHWIDLNENVDSLNINEIDIDLVNVDTPSFVIPIFAYGFKEFGKDYVDHILSYMNRLDYDLTDIELKKGKRGYRIYVEEGGKYYVEQSRLSLRMFRALSLLIVLVLVKKKHLPMCILIDDLGDGFDLDNAKNFMDILSQVSYNSSIQFFATSTNRFVLNNVHLKNWSVIDRVGSKSIFYNMHNSKENFEDFKYTSLNNADFFTTQFYKNGFEAEEDELEN